MDDPPITDGFSREQRENAERIIVHHVELPRFAEEVEAPHVARMLCGGALSRKLCPS